MRVQCFQLMFSVTWLAVRLAACHQLRAINGKKSVSATCSNSLSPSNRQHPAVSGLQTAGKLSNSHLSAADGKQPSLLTIHGHHEQRQQQTWSGQQSDRAGQQPATRTERIR